jgi:hypothetical protein
MLSQQPGTTEIARCKPPDWLLGEEYGSRISQRNLNNCFAYDLVPSATVITAAVRAARRVNDFPSAVRVFEGTCPAFHPPDFVSPFHNSAGSRGMSLLVNGANQATPITNTNPGIKFKVENKGQYTEYLQELEPLREELGIPLKEVMYPEEK